MRDDFLQLYDTNKYVRLLLSWSGKSEMGKALNI